jgi:hypothetical protein
VLGLALASVAAGQGTGGEVRDAHRLGGPTSFYAPPLRTVAHLKAMAARKGMADDIRLVLRDSGIPEVGDALLATLTGATAFVAGQSCDEATPVDGVIVACDFQPGSTLLWMAYRPNAMRGVRTPGRIERFRWAGAKPFKALLFRVTNDYKIYTFILPMVCSNLSLMSIKEIEGEPVSVSADRVCDPPMNGRLRATFRATSRDLARVQRVGVSVNGQAAGELTAPSWTLTSDKPGEYTFDATDAKGRPYAVARRSIRVEECPVAPVVEVKRVAPTCSVVLSSMPVKGGYEITVDATKSTTGSSRVAPAVTVILNDEAGVAVGQPLTIDSSLSGKIVVRRHGTYRATATVTTPQPVVEGNFRYEGSATCDASVAIEKPAGGMAFFFDVLAGKDRRVRPDDVTGIDFAQCSPLLGVKLGVAKRFSNDWEVAGGVGLALSLVTDNNKVKESEPFVDLEVNKYLSGGAFLGTGFSVWDLSHRDTLTPAWLLHFGVPLSKSEKHPVFFVGEGRLFFDHIGDIRNNYLLWGGIRVQFKK